MKSHLVKPEKDLLKKEEQLAWKMAQLAFLTQSRARLCSSKWLSIALLIMLRWRWLLGIAVL